MANDGDSIDLAYPNSETRRGRVGHGVSKTLATGDTMGTIQRVSDTERLSWDKWGYEEGCKDNNKILQILRNQDGEEAFCEWAIRGLWCILAEAVLWEKVYAKGIFENWQKQPNMVERSYFCKNSERIVLDEEIVRKMWIEWQDRYTSYRQRLSEQQFKQLKSLVQKLPHEVASWKEFVQSLQEASEGLRLLRKALSEIQEIWRPDASWEVQRKSYRIRKLTPLSCWRLMSFDDEDFEKAEKVNSNSQLYKQAGNSIVVKVLEAILKNLLKDEK